MSCPFKDILGRPGEGIHSARIGGVALFDTLATIIGAYFIQKKFYPETSYLKVLLIFFIIGELLHVLFCVRTTLASRLIH
jgi:hypothetical protein